MMEAKREAMLAEVARIRDEMRFARICSAAAMKRKDVEQVAWLTPIITHLANEAQTLVERARESE